MSKYIVNVGVSKHLNYFFEVEIFVNFFYVIYTTLMK